VLTNIEITKKEEEFFVTHIKDAPSPERKKEPPQ